LDICNLECRKNQLDILGFTNKFYNAYVIAPTLHPKESFHPAQYTPMKNFIDTLSKEERDKILSNKEWSSYFM